MYDLLDNPLLAKSVVDVRHWAKTCRHELINARYELDQQLSC
jgi:hypothetical protein